MHRKKTAVVVTWHSHVGECPQCLAATLTLFAARGELCRLGEILYDEYDKNIDDVLIKNQTMAAARHEGLR